MAQSDINVTMSGVDQTIARVVKRTAFACNNELKRATPVDTGWARANWVPSVGSPVNTTNGSREAVSAAAQSAGEARLLVYRTNQGDVWITNNVPYIQKLNEGHSKQSPAGWIQAAIRTAVASIAGGLRS